MSGCERYTQLAPDTPKGVTTSPNHSPLWQRNVVLSGYDDDDTAMSMLYCGGDWSG